MLTDKRETILTNVAFHLDSSYYGNVNENDNFDQDYLYQISGGMIGVKQNYDENVPSQASGLTEERHC